MIRFICAFATCLAMLTAAEATRPHPLLGQVHKVYLLPMGGGMDQYIARQLTAQGVLEVVTDAKLADAVFTESIGADFESRLADLLPSPPPPVVEEKPAATKRGREQETETIVTSGPRLSSFGRGRGNVFLVDLKSRSVVWATHRMPKNRTPSELDRASGRVVETLARAIAQK